MHLAVSIPQLMGQGGPAAYLLFVVSAVMVSIVIERWLHYHRAQIDSMAFVNGIRNVLRQENVVEAISICDATPGPVARLTRAAILSRNEGREGVRESMEEVGITEVSVLERRLNLLGTIAQIAPLIGLLGAILGMMDIFEAISQANVLYPEVAELARGVWQGLIPTAMGLAVGIVGYAAHNALVGRVNSIVLDMEKVVTEIAGIVVDSEREE